MKAYSTADDKALELQRLCARLHAYTGEEIKVMGKIQVTVCQVNAVTTIGGSWE